MGSLAGVMLSGPRVALRPLSESDLRMVVAWYEGATEHRRSLKGAQSDGSDLGLLAITFREEDGAIGVMEYRVGVSEDGWLSASWRWSRGCEGWGWTRRRCD